MSSPGPAVLGVVLAGGASRRFGSPKALASFHGQPLWQRAARTLEQTGLDVVVLANDPLVADAVTGEVRRDLRPGQGPLAGVETGLLEARERGLEGVLALACDLVLVEVSLLADLLKAWPGRGAAAFASEGRWGVLPVCSIWGLDLLPDVRLALDEGRLAAGELLRSVPLEVVDPAALCFDAERIFRGANRPEDLATLELESTP